MKVENFLADDVAATNGRATAQGFQTEAPPTESTAEIWCASYDAEMAQQPQEVQEATQRSLNNVVGCVGAVVVGLVYMNWKMSLRTTKT